MEPKGQVMDGFPNYVGALVTPFGVFEIWTSQADVASAFAEITTQLAPVSVSPTANAQAMTHLFGPTIRLRQITGPATSVSQTLPSQPPIRATLRSQNEALKPDGQLWAKTDDQCAKETLQAIAKGAVKKYPHGVWVPVTRKEYVQTKVVGFSDTDEPADGYAPPVIKEEKPA